MTLNSGASGHGAIVSAAPPTLCRASSTTVRAPDFARYAPATRPLWPPPITIAWYALPLIMPPFGPGGPKGTVPPDAATAVTADGPAPRGHRDAGPSSPSERSPQTGGAIARSTSSPPAASPGAPASIASSAGLRRRNGNSTAVAMSAATPPSR